MNRIIAHALFFAFLGACQRAPEQAQSNQQNAPAQPPAAPQPPTAPTAPQPPAAPLPPEPGTPGGLADDRTPLEEPKGPIDPKSPEGAGQVVQHYGALIEQKRFTEAEKLWGDAAVAKKMTAELKAYSEAHLQVGKPSGMEGAAGSSYITVPIVLYGTLSGKTASRRGDVTLRRVNDVPGSTEAQRRWHIERVEWKTS